MKKADRIWQKSQSMLARWGLSEIPFSESTPTTEPFISSQIFIGRDAELEQVITRFFSRNPQRLLIYGQYGIGKTAFLLEVLGVLQRNAEDTLTAYLSLPPEMDLATAALYALARAMKDDDEWAQHLLQQEGLTTQAAAQKRKRKITIDAKIIKGETEREEVSTPKSKFPTLNFEDLLNRAIGKYRQVVLAIDDLDKQDPARVRQLLQDAQGLLKGGASFILTGHPTGLTRELLISNLGLFDLSLELKPLKQGESYRLLVEYLDSARLIPVSEREAINPDDADAVKPFLPETASALCQRAQGVPRWINRLANYVLLKALELRAEVITLEILQQGFASADEQLRNQALTMEDTALLELISQKGLISDANVTLPDLESLGIQEFSELLPRLDKLVQLDLLRRKPTDQMAAFEISPLLLKPEDKAALQDDRTVPTPNGNA